MKLYTWKDVDRLFQMKQEKWKNMPFNISVYPDCCIVLQKGSQDINQDISQCFSSIFENFPADTFLKDEMKIKLELGDEYLPIYTEYGEYDEVKTRKIRPLFREVLYHIPDRATSDLSCPVIVFHSYKGGVGRTLSLLAFAKAWSELFTNKKQEKLMIVDSDIEAPGLTWIASDGNEPNFSYLDLLTLIQDNSDIERIVDLSYKKLIGSNILIETSKKNIEHIFIPTYRYKEQLLDLYASPETITNGRNKEFFLGEVLARLGVKLGASAVLVDLRAGLSEFSSTLLFDQRVKKYIVTSTSMQSVHGTGLLLEYLLKGIKISPESNLPEVFLTMIPTGFPEDEELKLREEIISKYQQDGEDTEWIDNLIIKLPFASELIHLSGLKQISGILKDRIMYQNILELVKQKYSKEDEKEVYRENRRDYLKKIHEMASSQITADSGDEFNILMTEPLRYIKDKYSDTIPTTIVMGAKGTGKTFLYKKMVQFKDWSGFSAELSKRRSEEKDGLFLPFLSTSNPAKMTKLLTDCIKNINENIDGADVKNSVYLKNASQLRDILSSSSKVDWDKEWERLLSQSFSSKTSSFDEIHAILSEKNKKIVYLIDGTEEIFRSIATDEREQEAIISLCQYIIPKLMSDYQDIGMILFLRRDIARCAIKVNFEQFEESYKQQTLKWTTIEAKRLVVWLVDQSIEGFYREDSPIAVASEEIIDSYLIKIWGRKLGKDSSNEAYSSRWILAALADFSGQLQARDMIRFLSCATENFNPTLHYDRILIPREIKNSVRECSTKMVQEIKQEYASIEPIFEKLENLQTEKKVLPFISEEIGLSRDEENTLLQEYFLKKEDEKCYLPEKVRHGLQFKYKKGARPRVLW